MRRIKQTLIGLVAGLFLLIELALHGRHDK